MEAIAIEQVGIPAIVLMENAALAVTRHVLKALAGYEAPKAVIVAGKGGNGGDGLAVARHLHNQGVAVSVIFMGDAEEAAPNTRIHYTVAKNLNIPILPMAGENSDWEVAQQWLAESHVVVDAMLGFGMNKPLNGPMAQMVQCINAQHKHVVAIDLPTGICADDGRVLGCGVHAKQTVTFGYGKVGLYAYPGAHYAGEVLVEDIGLPPVVANVPVAGCTLTLEEAKTLLPLRPNRSNKGTYGKLFVLAGCDHMPGAATMAVAAAYKGGAGLVRGCVTVKVASVLHQRVPDAVTTILPDAQGFLTEEGAQLLQRELPSASALVLGPGLGSGEGVQDFVKLVLAASERPMVIDADGLNALGQEPAMLKQLKAQAVVTPHPGEMSRLTGLPIQDIMACPVQAARTFAQKYGVVTLLKDAHTIVANPDGQFFVNTTGTPAMAKAGGGDILAGVIGAFLAQGVETFDAARLAAFMLGLAGEAAAKKLGLYSVGAWDILEALPYVFQKLS